MKYKSVLEALPEAELFTPSSIATFADNTGLILSENTEMRKRLRRRIRVSICQFRLAKKQYFPEEGDGWVTLWGQAPVPGWFGWRWKAAVNDIGTEPSPPQGVI